MMFIETAKAKITFLVQSQNYREALLKLVEAKITGSLMSVAGTSIEVKRKRGMKTGSKSEALRKVYRHCLSKIYRNCLSMVYAPASLNSDGPSRAYILCGVGREDGKGRPDTHLRLNCLLIGGGRPAVRG